MTGITSADAVLSERRGIVSGKTLETDNKIKFEILNAGRPVRSSLPVLDENTFIVSSPSKVRSSIVSMFIEAGRRSALDAAADASKTEEAAISTDQADAVASVQPAQDAGDDTVSIFEVLEEMQRVIDSYRHGAESTQKEDPASDTEAPVIL